MSTTVLRKSLLTLLCGSTLLLTGCMKDFPELTYNPADAEYAKLLQEEAKADNSYAARLQLARLQFEHNHLEEADQLLEALVKEDSNDMEALAWYGANQCKLVGEAFPWLLGIDKYLGAKSCLDKVKTALDKAPDNFTVQLIAINTGSAVNLGDSLAWATSTRAALEKSIQQNPQHYPADVVDYFYLAAAENDLAHDNVDSGKNYLNKVLAEKHNERLTALAAHRLASIQ
jgi:predicted negative regulator of RcsB-dependent stress response